MRCDASSDNRATALPVICIFGSHFDLSSLISMARMQSAFIPQVVRELWVVIFETVQIVDIIVDISSHFDLSSLISMARMQSAH